MNHFLEFHNKIGDDEYRIDSCFEYHELGDAHCCMSKLLQPHFDVVEEHEEETELHTELFESAIDRYYEVIDLAELTRFELKVAATMMNCEVDKLDMTLALPRDFEAGENAEGALNFFECDCIGRDISKRLNMMYEKKGPFPKDPESELTDS